MLAAGEKRPGGNPLYETAESQLSNPTGHEYGSEAAPEAPAEGAEVSLLFPLRWLDQAKHRKHARPRLPGAQGCKRHRRPALLLNRRAATGRLSLLALMQHGCIGILSGRPLRGILGVKQYEVAWLSRAS